MTHDLVRGGMLVMFVSIAGVGLGYVSHVLLAQWLGVEHYGYYVYALAWLNVFVILVQLGMNTSIVRLTAELRAENDFAAILGLSRFSTLTVLAVGVGIVLLGSIILSLAEAWGWGAMDQVMPLFVMLPLVIVLGLLNQRLAIIQGFERVAQAHVYLDIVRPVLLIAFLGAMWLSTTLGAAEAMLANMAATLVALALAALALTRLFRAQNINAAQKREYRVRAWLSVSLPYLAIGGLTVVMDQSDVLILGAMIGGAATGLYLSALKLSQLILFPMLALRSRAAPLMARLYAEGRVDELQRQMNTATVASVLSGLVLIIGVIWAREHLLSLFGPDFVVAAPIVVVLAVGMGAFMVTGGVEVFLIFGPFERITMLIYVFVVALNLFLNLLLIPYFGVMGAAYATMVTIITRSLISSYVVWRRTGVLPWRRIQTVASFGEDRTL